MTVEQLGGFSNLMLYEVNCVPRSANGELWTAVTSSGSNGIVRVVVAAPSSAEATRKVLQQFQKAMPADNVKSVEIVSMSRLTTLDTALVVV